MVRTVEQNQRMRDQRREQLLTSALRLFASRGLAATKIADIAEAAGISQGLMYHYFRSKEEVFVELIRGAFSRMNAAARGLEKLPLTPREKIDKAMTDLLRGVEQNEDFSRYFLLIAQASASEAIPDEAKVVIRKQRGVPYAVMARIMRAGQKDGSIKPRDPNELAVTFWTMVRGIAIHRATWGLGFRAPDPQFLTSIFFNQE